MLPVPPVLPHVLAGVLLVPLPSPGGEPPPRLPSVLEAPLEKKAGRNYGPPGTKRLVYFIDDLNISRSLMSTLWASALTCSSVLTPVAGRLLDSLGVRPVVFQACMYGSTRAKWTRLVTNCSNFRSLARTCDGKPEHEPWPPCRTQPRSRQADASSAEWNCVADLAAE